MDFSCVWPPRTVAGVENAVAQRDVKRLTGFLLVTGIDDRSHMARRSERFTKRAGLGARDEFQRVFDRSQRAKRRYWTVLVAPNDAGVRRLGIVASQKVRGTPFEEIALRD
jgi:hypothetical protein